MITFTKIFFEPMKKIIDILAIILPSLIILLGFIRILSVKKARNFNGTIMSIAILLLLVGLTRNIFFKGNSSHDGGNKSLPLTVSKHSETFNTSLENILSTYNKITEAFSKNDSAAINYSAALLKQVLDSFNMDELKNDTLIYQTARDPLSNASSELASIISDPSMNEKRGSLNIFSDELYTFLRTVHYDMAILYWLECATAFGEDRPGYWISKSEQPVNPYAKEDCAVVRTKINFVPADSTLKQ